MRFDESGQPDALRPTVFPVAPVVRRGRVLPRVVVVALAVGLLAFLAGVQVGAGGTSDRARPSVPPSASPPAAVTEAPVSGTPGSSAFLRAFRPADLIAAFPGGTGCVTTGGQEEAPRSRQYGPRMTFVRYWMTFCPLPVDRRQSFLLGVFDALVQRVPSDAYSWSSSSGGSGSALFPYAADEFVGTVSLAADAAGSGLEIVITVEERLAP